jgi:hypothetical protein
MRETDSTTTAPMGREPRRPDREAIASHRDDLSTAARLLGIAAFVATFVPPGLFAAPILGGLASVFGVVALGRARSNGGPTDQAVIRIILGAGALATSLTGIWVFRHVIARAIHDASGW